MRFAQFQAAPTTSHHALIAAAQRRNVEARLRTSSATASVRWGRSAKKTIANFVEKASRVYENERNAALASSTLEMRVRRWLGWVKCGINVTTGWYKNQRGPTITHFDAL